MSILVFILYALEYGPILNQINMLGWDLVTIHFDLTKPLQIIKFGFKEFPK